MQDNLRVLVKIHFAAGPQVHWLGESDEHAGLHVRSEQQRQRACGPRSGSWFEQVAVSTAAIVASSFNSILHISQPSFADMFLDFPKMTELWKNHKTVVGINLLRGSLF
jgi:hypothetical protein